MHATLLKSNRSNLLVLNKKEKTKIYLQAVESYAGRLYNIAYFILGNKELAEDAVQESFIKIWKNLDTFSFHSSIYTWMYRIAHNTAINIYNREKKYSSSELDYEPSKTENPIDKMTLNTAIKILSPKEKQSIVMFYFLEYKIREIAEELSVSENTVKSWLKRSKEKLKDYILER